MRSTLKQWELQFENYSFTKIARSEPLIPPLSGSFLSYASWHQVSYIYICGDIHGLAKLVASETQSYGLTSWQMIKHISKNQQFYWGESFKEAYFRAPLNGVRWVERKSFTAFQYYLQPTGFSFKTKEREIFLFWESILSMRQSTSSPTFNSRPGGILLT